MVVPDIGCTRVLYILIEEPKLRKELSSLRHHWSV